MKISTFLLSICQNLLSTSIILFIIVINSNLLVSAYSSSEIPELIVDLPVTTTRNPIIKDEVQSTSKHPNLNNHKMNNNNRPKVVPQLASNTSSSTNSAVWTTFFVKENEGSSAPTITTTTTKHSTIFHPISLSSANEKHDKSTLLKTTTTDNFMSFSPIKGERPRSSNQAADNIFHLDHHPNHRHSHHSVIEDDAHYSNLHLLLSKISNKVLQSHQQQQSTSNQQQQQQRADQSILSEIILPHLQESSSSQEKGSERPFLHLKIAKSGEHLQSEESIRSDQGPQNSQQNSQNSNKPKEYFINIPPQAVPIRIRFNTHTTPINAEQNHVKTPGKTKKMLTVEQPDRLIHTVKKPVIQEIHELIQPYRKRLQMVQPVHEQVQTTIAKELQVVRQKPDQPMPVYRDAPIESQNHNFESQETGHHDLMRIPKIQQPLSAPTPSEMPAPQNPPPFLSGNPGGGISIQTQNLSSDIELDKIIANLIKEQEEQNQRKNNDHIQQNIVYHKDRFSNMEFSKPDDQNVKPDMISPEEIQTQNSDQRQFYQQLSVKLQDILMEQERQNMELQNSLTSKHNFNQMDNSGNSIAIQRRQSIESDKSKNNNIFYYTKPESIPKSGNLKLLMSLKNADDAKNFKIQTPKRNPNQNVQVEEDEDDPSDLLSSGDSSMDQEIVEILHSGQDQRNLDTSVEFANRKSKIHRTISPNGEIVDEYSHDQVLHDPSSQLGPRSNRPRHGPSFKSPVSPAFKLPKIFI